MNRQVTPTGSLQGDETSQTDAQPAPEQASKLSLVPPTARHGEAAAATITWLLVLPTILFLPGYRASIMVVVVAFVSLLVMHSFTLRPFYQETVEDDDEDLDLHIMTTKNHLLHATRVSEIQVNLPAQAKDETEIEKIEECKFVLTCLLVVSAVGCGIALSTGGALAIHSWIADSVSDCNVANLADMQQHAPTMFFCNDGHVDMGKQVSTIKRDGVVESFYTTYHMAPVYSEARSKEKVPVALAVSKNDDLIDEPCDYGLCGILTPLKLSEVCTGLSCVTPADKLVYSELRHAMGQRLEDKSAFDESIPIIELTVPTNPMGKLRHFVMGATLYLLTLGGLIAIQVDYFYEAKYRPPIGPETRYEALEPPQ